MQTQLQVLETLREHDVPNPIQKIFASSNFLDNISTGMLLRNAEGVITDCNSAAESILGLSRDVLIGKTSTDLENGAVNLDGTPYEVQSPLALKSLRSGESLSGIIAGVTLADESQKWLSMKVWRHHRLR
jgi:PAS domain-containing protein